MKRYKKVKVPFHRSVRYALVGLGHAIYSQRNIKLQLCAATVAISLGYAFNISLIEWYILSTSIVLVLSCELLNTALELAIDLSTRENRIRAKLGKDVAAGAVLIASIYSCIIGYLIFFDRFVNLINGGF